MRGRFGLVRFWNIVPSSAYLKLSALLELSLTPGTASTNNKAPVWAEAIIKGGYGSGPDGECSIFDQGKTGTKCITTLAPKVVNSFKGTSTA